MSRLCAVIGSPVAHSLSPVIHRAAFAAAGRDWSYVAFDVPAGRAAEALAAMRVLGIAGFSVTTPHKQQVAECVDELDPAAAALRSVNTVTLLPDGRLHGSSTDGDGLVDSLLAAGVAIDGAVVAVLGAGAAARSVIDALGRRGAAAVRVVNRNAERAAAAASLATFAVVAADAAAAVEGADVIVNATSVGFGGSGTDPRELPLRAELITAEHTVVDLVYHPLDTVLLRAARVAGARALDGLGMLIHQAALQQQRWTGEYPDVSAMRAAVEAAL